MPEALSINADYEKKYGFKMPEKHVHATEPGLSEKIVREISEIKNEKGENGWINKFRLRALEVFFKKKMPAWGADFSKINFDEITYYMKPTEKSEAKWEDVPKEIKETFDKLGIPQAERSFLAGVGAQYDSENVYHSILKPLEEKGVIFVDPDTGLRKYPEIFKKYFGTIVPPEDNKFAALNSAAFSGGSFIYIPPGVDVEQPLQAYFRINAQRFGQFERTLIIVDKGSKLHYIEGCSAPTYSKDSLHAAVVEIVALPGSHVRYTTLQNWSNNVYNLVTKRAHAYENATVEWVDANIGSRVTTKFPSVYLRGRNARADILSVAFAGDGQYQDTGGKAIHLAPNTSSRITAKSVSKGGGRTTYRGLLYVGKGASNVKSSIRCVKPDTILLGDNKPIAEYKIDDKVIGLTGLNKVKQTFTNPFEGEMIEISATGMLPFEVTKEHPIYVAKSKTVYPCVMKNNKHKHSIKITLNELHWEKAENLTPKKSFTDGHYVAIPRLIGNTDISVLDLSPFIKNPNITKIVRKDLPINENISWLMGLFVAEGCTDDGHVKFSLGTKEKALLEKTTVIIQDLGYSLYKYQRKNEKAVEISVYADILSKAFREWFGHKAMNKKIPDFILLHKDPKILKSFLEGYIAGDGSLSRNCSNKYNVIYIVTVSKLLAEQIQILGARLGIFFRITKVYDAKQNFIQNRKVNVNTKYDVRCNLSEKIQAKILDKFILVPIRKIEQKYYKGLVYNIETTDHTYLVSNAVTHNCDALLIDENSRTDTYPYNEIHDDTATITHEATVGKIGEDMLFYLMSRGLGEQDALNMVVMGFFEPFAKEIPLEYALEFNRLIQLEMAGSVG